MLVQKENFYSHPSKLTDNFCNFVIPSLRPRHSFSNAYRLNMTRNNSPIDKPSYSTESPGYDPEVIYHNTSRIPQPTPEEVAEPSVTTAPQPQVNVEQPVSPTPTPAPAPAPSPSPAPAQVQTPSSKPKATHVLPDASKAKTILFDSRTALFVGLVLLVFSIYAFIVSVSYFRSIGSDQSAVLNGEFAPELLSNTGGPFGAWLSNLLIHDWLGVGSFLLIIYIGMCGLMLLNVFKTDFWKLTFRCLLCATAISIIGGFITVNLASPFYWGGMHGHLLNERLILLSGIWGALGVSIVMGGLVGLLFFKQLKFFFSLMNQGVQAFRARQQRRRADREAREQAEAQRQAEEDARRAEIAAMEDARLKAEHAAAMAKARAEEEAATLEKLRLEAESAAISAKMAPAQAARVPDPVAEEVPTEDEIPEEHLAYVPQDTPETNVAETVAATEQAEIEPIVEQPVAPTQRPLFADDEEEQPKAPEMHTPAAAAKLTSEVFVSNGQETVQVEETVERAEPASPLFGSSEAETASPLFPEETVAPAADEESAETDPASDEDYQDEESATDVPPLGSLESLYDPRQDLSHFKFPSIDILPFFEDTPGGYDQELLDLNKSRITKTLGDYNINIQSIEATVGPTVILYEIVPAEGVRVARVKSLEDDLALKLAAVGVRIIAPMPGRGTIGIEVPREDPQTVSMRSVIDSPEFQDSKMELPMALGRTVSNQVFVRDLAKMPHLLVAGATGMGKSVGLNAIIASLLYKKHPSELKLVLIDPKQVEFSIYAKLERHYLAKLPDEEEPVIVDPAKAIATLNSLCVEMENRYALLKKADMRNIKDYNHRFVHRQLNPNDGHKFLPYIVVIVDEFADLIMMAGKDIETPIARIAQKARAVGIHMIIATQRPSTNVITGLIKANFPGRIAFRVFQMVDSRTILDRPGANQLIGRGDLLFSNNGKVDRVQCAFIDTPEVLEICRQISSQTGYPLAYELPEYTADEGDTSRSSGSKMSNIGDRDELFEECARHVVSANLASTSALQRHYSIGFNRAGKIMDQMEAVGIVGRAQGGKPRQVLTDMIGLESILASI